MPRQDPLSAGAVSLSEVQHHAAGGPEVGYYRLGWGCSGSKF